MSEVVQDTELNQTNKEVFPQDRVYVVVCSHGRTRSKFIARQLDQLGYNNVQVIGLRDTYVSREEKISLLKQAHAVVCASSTDLAEITHLLAADAENAMLLSVDIPEADHFVLSTQALQGKKTDVVKAANTMIRDRLVALGFSENS